MMRRTIRQMMMVEENGTGSEKQLAADKIYLMVGSRDRSLSPRGGALLNTLLPRYLQITFVPGDTYPSQWWFHVCFLVCQDIISPFGGFAVRPFFPPLLSPRKCLIRGILQENTYQNMLGSLGPKVWILDMAGHGCLISWCFNVCNSIERVFQPGIMHFHFFLMRFLDIFVENGHWGRENRDYNNSQV